MKMQTLMAWMSLLCASTALAAGPMVSLSPARMSVDNSQELLSLDLLREISAEQPQMNLSQVQIDHVDVILKAGMGGAEAFLEINNEDVADQPIDTDPNLFADPSKGFVKVSLDSQVVGGLQSAVLMVRGLAQVNQIRVYLGAPSANNFSTTGAVSVSPTDVVANVASPTEAVPSSAIEVPAPQVHKPQSIVPPLLPEEQQQKPFTVEPPVAPGLPVQLQPVAPAIPAAVQPMVSVPEQEVQPVAQEPSYEQAAQPSSGHQQSPGDAIRVGDRVSLRDLPDIQGTATAVAGGWAIVLWDNQTTAVQRSLSDLYKLP